MAEIVKATAPAVRQERRKHFRHQSENDAKEQNATQQNGKNPNHKTLSQGDHRGFFIPRIMISRAQLTCG